jgi:hypothetical protein
MAADDIRIAWNTVTETLHAVHPDDGTYAAVEISVGGDHYADAPAGIQDRTTAPGGRRLILGPTLAEIAAAFEHSNHLGEDADAVKRERTARPQA